MCLRAVDKKPREKAGIGYKLAQRKGNQFLSCDYGVMVGKVIYPLDTWKTDDEDYSITATNCQQYPTGFHVSLSEEHMRVLAKRNNANTDNLVVIKCQFRKVVASDMKSDSLYGPTVVAREIKNLGII